MPPKRRFARKPRRKMAPKRKPMRKSAPKSSFSTFKKMLAKTSEKKRFYIAPIALTNGDITCVKPQTSYRNGGNTADLIQPFPIGQQYAAGSFGVSTTGGWVSMDITPYPVENNGFSGREGSSITLQSSYAQFKITQQSANTLTPIRLRFTIVATQGAPQDPKTALESFYLQSALPNGSAINANGGLIDYNSNTSPDQRGQFRVLYNKTTVLKQDNIDAGLQVKNHIIKMKYNRGVGHVVRFLQNTTSITHGQLLLFITADAGNIADNSFTGAGALTLVNNAAFSGAAINFNICHYYTDL